MQTKNKKICIILPHKIGDSILAIPFLICLKQLMQKYKKNYCLTVLGSNGLTSIFQLLNIFPVENLSLFEKIKSQLLPYDEAIFLDTSSKNMFLKSKNSLEMNNPQVKNEHKIQNYLIKNKNLSIISAEFVSICLYIDFNEKQIIETFEFSPEKINTEKIQTIKAPNITDKYIVCCMETSSGRKADRERLWAYENYFAVTEYLYKNFQLKTVFIGIDNSKEIPQKIYHMDFRKTLNLSQVAKIISGATAYIGNDTGPLHIANLLKKPSIAIYGRQESKKQYSPIFPELNIQLVKPKISKVIENISLLLQK